MKMSIKLDPNVLKLFNSGGLPVAGPVGQENSRAFRL